jgi:hypothetical protein
VFPATQEAETRRKMAQGEPGHKGREDPISINKLGMVAFVYHPSHAAGINRRIEVQAIQGKNLTPYPKNS